MLWVFLTRQACICCGCFLLGRLAYVVGVSIRQACICCGCFLLGRLAYVVGVSY